MGVHRGGLKRHGGGKATEMLCALPAHHPVHTGDRAPGEAASHVPVHLVAQEVLPAPITKLEELVRVGGHACGRGYVSGGSSIPPPPKATALQQGKALEVALSFLEHPKSLLLGQAATARAPMTLKGSPLPEETCRRINSLR